MYATGLSSEASSMPTRDLFRLNQPILRTHFLNDHAASPVSGLLRMCSTALVVIRVHNGQIAFRDPFAALQSTDASSTHRVWKKVCDLGSPRFPR